ncbi:hypothetical protein CALVIDRAFT_346156 [Calocera viscosa TUFC12733]|uniref:Choline/carnitine acyltransferase domain-containing protein n=1 Tax=Calocera viscosa (strain TUFC12733) TaxID=1330018 RepID=A0A167HB32_CALVF|nr:hypothetical protein CALVIDRAFT_346156 [Calocera viscosa TUFC12733]
MTSDGPAVGLLTGNDPDTGAKDYKELAGDPSNASILHDIYSCAFLVCLDDEQQPESSTCHSHAGRGTCPANREATGGTTSPCSGSCSTMARPGSWLSTAAWITHPPRGWATRCARRCACPTFRMARVQFPWLWLG